MSVSDAAVSVQTYSFPPSNQSDNPQPMALSGNEIGSTGSDSNPEGPPRLTKALVLSVMAAVDSSLSIEFQDTDIADVIDVDEQGVPYVQEIQAQPEVTSGGRSTSRGVKQRRPSRGEATKPGVAKANGLNHYRLICEACGHIVIAVVSAVLKAMQETYDENNRRFDGSAKPTAPVRKKRGGILGFKELAAKAKLSPWHFHRVFRNVTGVTPKAYGEALWDYLMRLYGFEVDELSDGQIGYSVGPASPEMPPLSGQRLSSASDMSAYTNSLSTGSPSNTNLLSAIENTGGSAQPPAPGGHIGRVRKSTRAAQQRSSRSRSRNRSQTQQQLLQTLSQMQISQPRKRSPSPGPGGPGGAPGPYMGTPLLNQSGSTLSPAGLNSVGVSNSHLDIYGSLVEDDIGLQPGGPHLAGTEDNLSFIFPALDNGFIEQGYDSLGIKEEVGQEWMEPDAEYFSKPDHRPSHNSWAGPDVTLAPTPSNGTPGAPMHNPRMPGGVHPHDHAALLAKPPARDALHGYGSSGDIKSAWTSQDPAPSVSMLSQSLPSQGLMLSLSSPHTQTSASAGSMGGYDTNAVIGDDGLGHVGHPSYYMADPQEFDTKDQIDMEFSQYTNDAEAPLNMLMAMQPTLSPTIEEDGIQNPVCF